jgi:PAS domain S-box-containing protein
MDSLTARRTPHQLIALFLVLAASIGAVTWRYHIGQKRAIERQVTSQLLTVADSKVKQISEWLSLRVHEVSSLLDNRMVVTVIDRVAEGRASKAEQAEVSEWLAAICRELQFANATLTDRQGNRIASAGRILGNADHIRELALGVIHTGVVQTRDLHTEPRVGSHLGLNIPLRLAPDSPVFGALLIAIEPTDYLYPMLSNWPVPVRTGEVLLVRREGDRALVLNELRRRPGSAMKMTIPMSRGGIPAIAALNGVEGVIQGRDLDGAALLAAARAVPGTNWRVVAQMDASEVFDPLWKRSLSLAFLALTLVLAAGGGVFILLRRQELSFDIAQSQAKASLLESEKRFRSVVENAPEGIVMISGLVYRYLNPAAVRMLGANSAEELIGRPAVEDVHPDEREAVAQRIQSVESGHPAPAVERRMLRRDRTEFRVEVMAVPIEHDGHPAAIAFYRDITERHRLEEQLRQSQKMDSIGRLAGGVAHDFNNMLTVINGYSDMLLEDPAIANDVREVIQEVRAAGERAGALTAQLLAFSRKQAAEPKPINLNEFVEHESSMLRRLIGDDVAIEMRMDPESAFVLADRGQLQQVLMNLVVNARDAMPSGGTILIETCREQVDRAPAGAPDASPGAYAVLEVADTGSGMSREVLERIFEPFYTTKKAGHGTGLGLATVYGIVHQTHGFIAVASSPGRGSTFRVYLPQTESRPAAVAAAAWAGPAREARETVLIVEDQDHVRKLACEVLRRRGYDVRQAASGAEALEIAGPKAEGIDLLLADVVMPGMSGVELAEILRRRRPDLPVLLTTGYAPEAIASQVPEDLEDYLRKPFTPDDLLRKIQERLAARRPGSTVLVIDDDDAVRSFLAKTLRKAGYGVREASDGRTGMRLLSEQPVHLVITDLVMPDQEGLETVRLLHERNPEMPVVAISGAFDGAFLKAAGIFGAQRLLRKPVEAQELLAVVRELTGKP